MGAIFGKVRRPLTRVECLCAMAVLVSALQGCAIYNALVQRGGSLPLGESGADWSPAVTTPAGRAFGVQIIQRF